MNLQASPLSFALVPVSLRLFAVLGGCQVWQATGSDFGTGSGLF